MKLDDAQLEQHVLHFLSTIDGGAETSEILKAVDSEPDNIKAALARLKAEGKIDSRSIGKSDYWYSLSQTEPKKILIVEDDKDINRLIKLSVGPSYTVEQAFDGQEAQRKIEEFKPDLIILDIMLPNGPDGLEICRKVKSNPETKSTTVIMVSAADAAVNRFHGIRYGADFYIKKPFEPMELKALTNIFLKKRGALFDPLVDLPEVKRLIENIRAYLSESEVEFTKLDIDGLEEYQTVHGKKNARIIVRLVSQMLQDKLKEQDGSSLLGYLGESSFVVAAKKFTAEKLLDEVSADFRRVTNFIKQSHMSESSLSEKIERGKTGGDRQPLRLLYYTIDMPAFKKQFESHIWPDLTEEAKDVNIAAVRNYSLEQIRKFFEDSKLDIDVSIKEVGGNLHITAGRSGKK